MEDTVSCSPHQAISVEGRSKQYELKLRTKLKDLNLQCRTS